MFDKIPSNAIELAKFFEGFAPTVYLCPGGYWTIGYGHRCKKEHKPITKKDAEKYLIQDMQWALKGVLKLSPVLLINEYWLGAIVDFTFNLGVTNYKNSTLRRRINNYQFDDVPYQLRRWVYAGGKKLKGLMERRNSEALFFQ